MRFGELEDGHEVPLGELEDKHEGKKYEAKVLLGDLDGQSLHTCDAAPCVAASPGAIVPISYHHGSIVKLLLPAGCQDKQ